MLRKTQFSKTQFTITTLLCLTAIVGALLVKGQSWLTLALIEATIAFVSIEALVRNLPTVIRNTLVNNCRRLDGSWSNRREQTELKAIKRLRWDIGSIIVLIMAPTTLMVWIVDREVVPLSVGVDAMLSFSPSESEWKSGLGAAENRFDNWKRNSRSRIDGETHKRALWGSWPLLVGLGFAWMAACWIVLRMTYVRMLKEMFSKARLRREEYMFHDKGQAWEPIPQKKNCPIR